MRFVMHPDTIEDPSKYVALGRDLVIENMDSRKPVGRTANELRSLFGELPEAGFCFDIAHAWSVDRTMQSAERFARQPWFKVAARTSELALGRSPPHPAD